MGHIQLAANSGVLVSFGGRRVLVDGIYGKNRFFSPPLKEVQRAVFGMDSPYRDVDFLLFTHRHTDHFDAAYTDEYARNNRVRGIYVPRVGADPASFLEDRRPLPKAAEQGVLHELSPEKEQALSIPLWDGILIEETVRVAPGATILPGCILRGNTTIAAGSVIGPGSVLTDAVIGKNCIVKNTYITESTLEENVSIGPFSQVRPGCHIAAGCKIGDFVEVKNSHIGQKTAIAHLTYVGDTDCGSGVNFGCGVAIANFNGKEKFRTTIGDGAFLGCNTNLVAPVTIGAGAYTAAGATVTRDVPEDAMLIARAEQTVKPGLARRFRREKK